MDTKRLIEEYEARSRQQRQESDSLRKRYERYSFIRLGAFFGSLGLIIYLWTEYGVVAGVGSALALLVGFGALVRLHQRILSRSKHQGQLAAINEREAAALKGNFSGFDGGSERLDPSHPYALDLDVFGEFSLFQYLNRSTTSVGGDRLAQMLLGPAPAATIRPRQEAVRDLTPRLEWRQDLQAIGAATSDEGKHILTLRQWLDEPGLFDKYSWLPLMLVLAPVFTVACIVTWTFWLPWYLALLLLIPNGWVIRKTVESVNDIHRKTAQAGRILGLYARIIDQLATPEFSAPLLTEQQSALRKQGGAARRIRRLSYIIEQLNVRYNFFAIFLNVGVLWDLIWVRRLEKWKAAERQTLPKWFKALAEFDALQSLATLRYNHPDWCWPELTEEARWESEQLGHPLIPEPERVANDFNQATQAHIMLLTGSNMAGKSTFLRTLGVNAVLAFAGAPVCARRFRAPLLQIYTSMRTQDALSDSASSFMAELKRLRLIIEAVKRGDQVFFLLDEILKGTNSRDRHRGGEALLKQLIRYGGAGVLATHDLELTSLEKESDGAVENWCMEVEIDGRDLHFPYRLERGETASFNASILMERMGIEFEEE